MKERRVYRTSVASIVLALALLLVIFTGQSGTVTFGAQTTAGHKPPKSSVGTASTIAEAAMPFRVGERLDYRIAWSSFANAATLELSIPEQRELYGWRTWHFQAAFHTIRSVRTLFAIDDQFDSYTDVSTLESRQFELYLNELGKKETRVLHLLPKGQISHVPGAAVMVLPGTRDPLGMLFTLRGVDWQRTPEVREPVFDGNDLWEMRAKLETPSEPVQVDAGSFKTSRVAIRVFQNGKENSSVQFTLWFSNDASRMPVLVAAELPFGEFRVELTAANTGAGPKH